MSGKITIRFQMEFEFPDRLSSNDRKAIGELRMAVDYLRSLADSPDGVTADRHHFRDAVDAIRTLANIGRRAQASNREDQP